jgi:hypothetical protein
MSGGNAFGPRRIESARSCWPRCSVCLSSCSPTMGAWAFTCSALSWLRIFCAGGQAWCSATDTPLAAHSLPPSSATGQSRLRSRRRRNHAELRQGHRDRDGRSGELTRPHNDRREGPRTQTTATAQPPSPTATTAPDGGSGHGHATDIAHRGETHHGGAATGLPTAHTATPQHATLPAPPAQ